MGIKKAQIKSFVMGLSGCFLIFSGCFVILATWEGSIFRNSTEMA